jgi:ADP-ribose pyrophosphatase YjhB (NUDIX family)
VDPRLWLLRHLFAPVWRLTRGLLMGVRAVVIDGEGRVLLVRHTYVPGWQLPGGGVEIGESATTALARELREEANVRLAGPVHLHGVFHHPSFWRGDHVLVYIVREFVQDGPPRRSREIAEAGFFAPDALPADTTPATRRRLAEVLDDAPPAQVW